MIAHDERRQGARSSRGQTPAARGKLVAVHAGHPSHDFYDPLEAAVELPAT